MTRNYPVLLAGVVASGMFLTSLVPPASATEHSKKTTPHAAVRAHAAVRHEPTVRHHIVQHSVVRRSEPSTRVAHGSTKHETHTTVTRVTIPRETAMRFESESTERLHSLARLRVPVHVTVHRVSLREITAPHPALHNVTFLTGTVVRREREFVVLRTSSGAEIPVATRVAVINETAFVPGTTVVIPAQFVNSGFTFVPAFTAADEEQTAALPAVAPCALNDGDADDAGVTGTFAPVGACLNNDGDADDGFNAPPLPSGFLPGAAPTVFSNSYMPVVAAGFVVSQVGSDVVIMTPNFTPLVVNASPAMSNGAVNSALSPGRFVTVYGYDVGNSLVATSIR